MTALIDLTVELRDGLSTYPGGPKMAVMNRITHEWTAGRYLPPAYSAADRVLMLNEHVGTHVDSPFHFIKDGMTIERVPLDRFWGTALVADVSERDPAVPVTREQIVQTLAASGERIRRDDIVLVRTWRGSRDAHGFLEAAALASDVGQWLVEEGAKAVGIDLPSVDSPGDRSFPVHIALLQAGVPIYENIANLERVPRPRFTFFGLPLPLAGGTGSAVRAVAVLD